MIYPLSMPFTQVCGKCLWENNMSEGGGIPLVDVPEDGVIEGGALPENADWASIEGNWFVCFCFCDHRELIEYNKSIDEDTGELDTSLFEDDEFTEVFRRLEVKLKVTRVANDPDHPGRPIIGFVGEMIAPSNSAMYGCVQLMADNHLKWRFYSGEMGGGAIWSSVGIQVGGVGSSFGVLGSWTTVFHDADDPVGRSPPPVCPKAILTVP
ncbi:hypothetical protein AN958_09031 [Leucoagaricus sp. SymC.cos]|nr:hypothetical protein AN958_09031 [Leucoagaricus sp. SymC.cos]